MTSSKGMISTERASSARMTQDTAWYINSPSSTMESSGSTLPSEADIDRGPKLIAIYVSLCSLAFIFLILRYASRFHIGGVGYDDAFMTISFVSFAFSWSLFEAAGLTDEYDIRASILDLPSLL